MGLGVGGDSTWVLAYESGCVKCRGVAAATARAAGGLLEVVSLRDQSVAEAVRRSGLTADRPTLVRPDGDRAYQGASLSWHLVRAVGLRRAVRILRLIGEYRQESTDGGVSRRRLLSAGGKVLLGALVAGAALSSSAAARAAVPGGSGSDLRRLNGDELAEAVRAAVGDSAVAELARALQQAGYADYEQVSSTAVAASGPGGRTVVWLPLWHAGTATLAIIVFRSWQPAQPRVMLLQEVDGRVESVENAPAAQDPVVHPALDWGCLAECVSEICPTCAGVCAFTGPFWPECVLDCRGGGVLSCYFFLC